VAASPRLRASVHCWATWAALGEVVPPPQLTSSRVTKNAGSGRSIGAIVNRRFPCKAAVSSCAPVVGGNG
jgi:hypothetical protein